jgi:hypothetical protein
MINKKIRKNKIINKMIIINNWRRIKIIKKINKVNKIIIKINKNLIPKSLEHKWNLMIQFKENLIELLGKIQIFNSVNNYEFNLIQFNSI